MSQTEWNIIGVLALIGALLMYSVVGVEKNVDFGGSILVFALAYSVSLLLVALGWLAVKMLVT